MKDPIVDKEKAEGSRETVDAALEASEKRQDNDRHRQSDERPQSGESTPGITNRPVAEEEQQQRELPPRGTAKRE